MKTKRARKKLTVRLTVKPHKWQSMFAQAREQRVILIAKYAADPTHRHVRELTGSFDMVHPKRKHLMKFYWCKICHADMPAPAPRKKKK